MKRVIIKRGTKALLFSRGEYTKCLSAGRYWIYPWQTIEIHPMTLRFEPSINLKLLENDESIADQLTWVKVADREIAVVYADGRLDSILTAGLYAFWRGLVDYSFIMADTSKIAITEPIDLKSSKSALFVPYVRTSKVESYEKAVLFVDNKPTEILESGEYFYWKNSIPLNTTKVDMRQRQLELIGQEILTKDKATVRANAYVIYQVTDIEKAVIENKDYEKQLYVAMQMALRSYLGQYTLDALLDKKSDSASPILETLRAKAAVLGLSIRDAGIKDIILPGEVRDIMSQVLIAEKKAQANSIMRREETAATRSLLNTAKLMEDNAMLYKLKEMEYVERVAASVSDITIAGGGQIVDQLKTLFAPSG